MILYLDTSSPLKHYVDEDYSGDVRGWVDGADTLATEQVTLVEAAAALTEQQGAGPERLAFSSFDAELNAAARAEALTVLEPLD